MSDFITLLGAEDVSRAGSRMQSAAETMRSAAGQIDAAFERQRIFMDDWLFRFAEALEQKKDG